jgi:glycosyltransferase involved in cell wall biosynthesis
MTSLLPGLSIVLPCYEEEENVARAISTAADAAACVSTEFEIVVVDDGSSDRTSEITSRFVTGSGRVRLLVHPENRGYGAALRTGLEVARMPWVLIADADLQFDFGELAEFASMTDSADLVAGRRVDRQDPLGRRMNAAAWNWLMRTLFDLPVSDVDCAFKLIRRELLDEVALTSTGALFSTELLIACRAQGARIVEHDVRHRPRVAGEPSGGRLSVIARAFGELAREYASLRTLSRVPRAQP